MGILTGASIAHMPTPEMTPNVPPSGSAAATTAARGWTGNKSIFDPPEPVDWWRSAKAHLTSLVIHVGVFGLLAFAYVKGSEIVQQVKEDQLKFDVVYLANNPGPGGGGGGNPKPAPPKKMELPKPTPQAVAPTPVPAPTTPPPPSINAPIMTAPTALLSASGTAVGAVDVPVGGGGKGSGIGTGQGSGVGPGTGFGFGGGVGRPGNGIDDPVRLREVKPSYTPEAMRAKIQGTAELEVVIGPDGRITETRVVKSLDKVFGLDQKAREAALATPFVPCKKQGQPVPCIVILEFTFTLR